MHPVPVVQVPGTVCTVTLIIFSACVLRGVRHRQCDSVHHITRKRSSSHCFSSSSSSSKQFESYNRRRNVLIVMQQVTCWLVFLCTLLILLEPTAGFSLPDLLNGMFSDTTTTATGTADMHELLLSRRTINDFEPTLPDNWEPALDRAILAATYAPNHKRTEPWRFHLLGKEAIQRVCELNAELVTAKKGAATGEKKLKRWLLMPGWLVVTQVIEDDSKHDSSLLSPNGSVREDFAAVCCAIHNLCLSLHADGIGTKWTSGPVNFDSKFGTAVGGIPKNERVVGTLWFGTASATPPAPKKRLGVQDVVTRHD